MQAYRLHDRGQARETWRTWRREIEQDTSRRRASRPVMAYWELLRRGRSLVAMGLDVAGMLERGMRNAVDVRRVEHTLTFERLPGAFDGLTILHISDLHFGGPVDVLPAVVRALPDRQVDLCLLGGDYSYIGPGDRAEVVPRLAALLDALDTRLGVWAVLGNHDGHETVDWLEELGIAVLANETLALEREGVRLAICGTDDPHRFHSPAADELLREAPGDFSIALVHSVELASEAARAGFDLYLAGHCHGGQVCVPGGWPVITGVHRHRQLYRGLWDLESMRGYTSTGAGVTGIPVRFNCPAEIAVLTLARPNGA